LAPYNFTASPAGYAGYSYFYAGEFIHKTGRDKDSTSLCGLQSLDAIATTRCSSRGMSPYDGALKLRTINRHTEPFPWHPRSRSC